MIVENFDVVSSSVFVQDGVASCDVFNPNPIVLGSTSERAIAIMRELYAPMINQQNSNNPTGFPIPMVVMNAAAGVKKRSANLPVLQVA